MASSTCHHKSTQPRMSAPTRSKLSQDITHLFMQSQPSHPGPSCPLPLPTSSPLSQLCRYEEMTETSATQIPNIDTPNDDSSAKEANMHSKRGKLRVNRGFKSCSETGLRKTLVKSWKKSYGLTTKKSIRKHFRSTSKQELKSSAQPASKFKRQSTITEKYATRKKLKFEPSHKAKRLEPTITVDSSISANIAYPEPLISENSSLSNSEIGIHDSDKAAECGAPSLNNTAVYAEFMIPTNQQTNATYASSHIDSSTSLQPLLKAGSNLACANSIASYKTANSGSNSELPADVPPKSNDYDKSTSFPVPHSNITFKSLDSITSSYLIHSYPPSSDITLPTSTRTDTRSITNVPPHTKSFMLTKRPITQSNSTAEYTPHPPFDAEQQTTLCRDGLVEMKSGFVNSPTTVLNIKRGREEVEGGDENGCDRDYSCDRQIEALSIKSPKKRKLSPSGYIIFPRKDTHNLYTKLEFLFRISYS
ncbi:hypothetical protein BKA69DRAFT_1084364 [Paraphysoderma sedebokerense]|nr:hypothetical protein BKA69DRAFT_1084364 [Paraphysoderma sedebokerense]